MHDGNTAQSVASAFGAAAMAMLGVPYLALLWGFIGSAVMLVLTPPETKQAAILSVAAGGFVGSAGGHGLTQYLHGPDSMLIVLALVIGAGAKPLLSAAIRRASSVIGGKGEDGK